MFWVCIAASSIARFTGSCFGATVSMETITPNEFYLNVSISRRSVLQNARITAYGNGEISLEENIHTFLSSHGTSLQKLHVYDDSILVITRLPMLGQRQVTLWRESEEDAYGQH
jgi:hypothetical protein